PRRRLQRRGPAGPRREGAGPGRVGRAARRRTAGRALRPRARRGTDRYRTPPVCPAGIAVSAPRMPRAPAASAMVHVAGLGGLLAMARARAAASRGVGAAVGGRRGGAGGQTHEPAGGPPPGGPRAEHPSPVADPSPAAPARPPPARSSTRAARPVETPTSGANGSGDGAASGAEALVSAVQSDVWVLAGSQSPGRRTARGGGSSASSPEMARPA